MTIRGAIMRQDMARYLLVLLTVGVVACSSSERSSSQPSASPTPSPIRYSSVSAPGTVLAAGDNTSGQLGIRARGDADTMQPVVGVRGSGALTGVRALAGGGRHSLAVRANGTVVGWGANDFGQLGNGSRRDARYPTPVSAADGRSGVLRGVRAVASDSNFSLALLNNGHVVTFGAGNFGQRGIGRRAAPLTPTTVQDIDGDEPLSDVRAIAADGSTEMALLEDGTVVGWGANGDGQLGDGTTRDRSLPVHVRGVGGRGLLTKIVAIALGGHNALAVRTDGTVLSWGANDRGQLGDGTRDPHRFPAPVRGIDGAAVLAGATQVSAAEKHGFARLRDGRVAGWGFGTAGQLGNGKAVDQTAPTLVLDPSGGRPLTSVASIMAGEAYAVAILDDGTALAWGAASAGQLGAGTRTARALPGKLIFNGFQPRHVRIAAPGVRHLLLSADP